MLGVIGLEAEKISLLSKCRYVPSAVIYIAIYDVIETSEYVSSFSRADWLIRTCFNSDESRPKSSTSLYYMYRPKIL